jgi:DNA-binding NarL/FixJ family response regulator
MKATVKNQQEILEKLIIGLAPKEIGDRMYSTDGGVRKVIREMEEYYQCATVIQLAVKYALGELPELEPINIKVKSLY